MMTRAGLTRKKFTGFRVARARNRFSPLESV